MIMYVAIVITSPNLSRCYANVVVILTTVTPSVCSMPYYQIFPHCQSGCELTAVGGVENPSKISTPMRFTYSAPRGSRLSPLVHSRFLATSSFSQCKCIKPCIFTWKFKKISGEGTEGHSTLPDCTPVGRGHLLPHLPPSWPTALDGYSAIN